MTGFDSRRNAYLGKGEHDALLEFKILSQRNRKIGMWAAKLLNISPLEAEKFVEDVVASVVKDPDDSNLISAIMKHLKARSVELSENQVRRQIGYFYQDAKMEVMTRR